MDIVTLGAKKVWISEYKDYDEVKTDLERRNLILKDYLISEEKMNEDNLECIAEIFHIEKEDGKEYYKCFISYYNLLRFQNSTMKELQEELIEATEELEELEEELKDIKDLDGDELEHYYFDSKEEYEKRLDDLDSDIYFLKLDIEMVERFLGTD